MKKATLISEMQKFHFGSRIFCSDGEDGVLAQLIFDPAAHRMTHIGVRHGRLFGKTVYLPFDTVVDATGDGVTLRIKRADVFAASSTAVGGVLLDSKSVVELARLIRGRSCSSLSIQGTVSWPILWSTICVQGKISCSCRSSSQLWQTSI